MKFNVLYEAALVESLNQNDEIKDTLNILFLMNINSGNTVVPMAKIKGFIKQKFDLSIDTDTLKKLLADMDSVTDFTDDEVNLASEDDGSETSEEADKEAVADMSAKAGAEEMEDLDTAGMNEAVDEEPQIRPMSNDTADRDMMFTLFSRLVCAKELAHLLHLNSDSAGEHLMYEKIYDMIDGMIDEFGEVYFMSRNIKIPNPLLDAKDFAEGNIEDKINEILDIAEKVCLAEYVDDGTKSLVSDCMKNLQRCLGFARQAKNDAEPVETIDLDVKESTQINETYTDDDVEKASQEISNFYNTSVENKENWECQDYYLVREISPDSFVSIGFDDLDSSKPWMVGYYKDNSDEPTKQIYAESLPAAYKIASKWVKDLLATTRLYFVQNHDTGDIINCSSLEDAKNVLQREKERVYDIRIGMTDGNGEFINWID